MECKTCGKEFKTEKGVFGHQVVHTEGWLEKNRKRNNVGNRKVEPSYLVKCPFCKKEYPNKGIGTHIWRKHGDGINHNPNANFGHIKGCNKRQRNAWNKGLKKETDERVKRNAESVSKTFQKQKANGTYIPHRMSTINKLKLSIRQSENNVGGKSKWFEISGFKVQGTWELRIAQLLNTKQIKWERPKAIKFEYMGKKSHYTPDFYLTDFKSYLEVKGHWWGNDKNKMIVFNECHPEVKIQIINKEYYKKINEEKLDIEDFILSGNSSVECLAED